MGVSCNIYLEGGTITVAGRYNSGMHAFGDTTYISGGIIELTSQNCIGVLIQGGSFEMTGGSIKAIGDYNKAIMNYFGTVSISGDAVVDTDGESCTGIEILNGYAEFLDDVTMTSTGGNSAAIQITGLGRAIIQTGPDSITATASDSFALHIASMGRGAMVYLAGSPSGTVQVAGNYGVILEVESLGIPLNYDTTQNGLSVRSIGTLTDESPLFAYYWDNTTNIIDLYDYTYTVIILEEVSPEYTYELTWGISVLDVIEPPDGPPAGPGTTPEKTPATGDFVGVFALCALIAVTIGCVSVFVARRKSLV
jgi:hypothetical protein